MAALEALIADGQIVWPGLAVMVIEFAVLVVWRRLTGHGPDLAVMAATLVSGGFFLLSLYAAITNAGAVAIGWPLLAAGAAHAVAVALLWRRG